MHTILNWLFPQTSLRNRLETMTPASLGLRVSRLRSPDPHLENIHSLFPYHDPLIREAIWALKYEGNRAIAKLLATLLYETITDSLSDEFLFSHFNTPLLIPLPLSRERLKERGWNQSELLASELEKLDKNNFFTVTTNTLQKIRHTLPQTKLSRAQRLSNLKNCFALSPLALEKNLVVNRNIILIDDVTTTSSTIFEAIRTLKDAGARQVIAFTVAH